MTRIRLLFPPAAYKPFNGWTIFHNAKIMRILAFVNRILCVLEGPWFI